MSGLHDEMETKNDITALFTAYLSTPYRTLTYLLKQMG